MSLPHTQKAFDYYEYKAVHGFSGSMGWFLADIHSQANNAMEVLSVKFKVPDDEFQNSGLVELLKDHLPKDNAPPANPSGQLPIVDLAIRLKALQDQYRPADTPKRPLHVANIAGGKVPLKYIIEIYVDAFATVCPNIEVMEFPAAWQDHLDRAKAKWGQQLGWTVEWKGASGDWVRIGKAVKENEKGEKYLDVKLGRGGNLRVGVAGPAGPAGPSGQ